MNRLLRVPVSVFENETAGIFESLRAYAGVIFRLEDHLDRFFESAKTLGVNVPETRLRLKARLKKELRESGLQDAFLRVTLVGDGLFVIVTERKHPKEIYQKGVSIKTGAVPRNLSQAMFPETKSTSCLNQVLATLDSADDLPYEILFLNSEGYLTEARIGNFFIAKHGRLFTPPPHGLLHGVTRRFVIECARLGKVPVEESPLTRHDLFNADEAFLTNTSWEILPIREADARRIGGNLPGPVTQKLQKIFHREVKKEISNAKN